jgi:acetyl-CoA carboxylase biotin carboxylase subunit
VEHPVTELVTGLDLVQLQIRIAAGETLPFAQSQINMRGHAIECRVYAEDPENNYFPSPGKITQLVEPSGPGVRVDSGVYAGWNVPLEYDPLLAKLIVYGENRQQAIARLQRALGEYFIAGVKTNLSLFSRILADERFVSGNADTGLLARLHLEKEDSDSEDQQLAILAAGLFRALAPRNGNGAVSPDSIDSKPNSPPSLWKKVARSEALS